MTHHQRSGVLGCVFSNTLLLETDDCLNAWISVNVMHDIRNRFHFMTVYRPTLSYYDNVSARRRIVTYTTRLCTDTDVFKPVEAKNTIICKKKLSLSSCLYDHQNGWAEYSPVLRHRLSGLSRYEQEDLKWKQVAAEVHYISHCHVLTLGHNFDLHIFSYAYSFAQIRRISQSVVAADSAISHDTRATALGTTRSAHQCATSRCVNAPLRYVTTTIITSTGE